MSEPLPRVWLDADAAPRAIKDILYRAAQRGRMELAMVANARQRVPEHAAIVLVVVGGDLDEADDFIAAHCMPGELVVTADVPLAARAVEAGAVALRPRGGLLDETNVGDALAVRDLRESLRSAGAQGGGPPPFDKGAAQRFANALDRWLARKPD